MAEFPIRIKRKSWQKSWHKSWQTGTLMAALVLAVPLAGCKTVQNFGQNFGDVTGSIGSASELPSQPDALRAYSQEWGKKYDAEPTNKVTAINYARALRALTQNAQAVAVMQNIALKYPNDMEVLGEYGKALADQGRLKEAADVLTRAHTPERPNWRILSVQGTVADQLGDHDQAQGYYAAALKIVPNEPSVLSNLGLSYALTKNLAQAEDALRLAAAQPRADMRVRQNLALILALEGKFKEAEAISAQDLSPADAANNVLAIRNMIAQSSTWKDIQIQNGKKKS
jgi:Flp pilus assembly protein TadD